MSPLQGVRVLDLTRILAGPFATMKLGDMGADVWKVERPGQGDDTRGWGPPWDRGVSTYFLSVNRSKRSLTLELSRPEARAALERLAARADVVVENFRPGVLEDLGLGWARLQQLNPRAILCSLSGYGQEGPEAARPSYDLIAQGEAGCQALTGFPDGPPVKCGLAIADLTAGQLAVEGILLALLQRGQTGRGARVEVALGDALLQLLTYQGQAVLSGQGSAGRLGNAHRSIVPYQAFASRDGWLNVAVGNDALWTRFCAALELPELAADPRFARNADRVERRAELVPRLERRLRERTTAEWLARLGAAEVPAGEVRDAPAALAHARAAGRGMVVELRHPEGGPLPMLGNPIRIDGGAAPGALRPPPGLGEHTEELLAQAGFSPAEVAALRAAGAV